MPFEDNVHVLDLLPAFVMDALTDDETLRVAGHLERCPSCQEELKRLQLVADDLPLALTQAEPPARVKSRLMESIHARQLGRQAVLSTAEAHKGGFSWQKYLPALGLVVFVVLAVVNVVLWRQLYAANRATASGFQVVTLANTSKNPGALGELVMNDNGQYGTLVVDNLAELGSASQYQVWLTRDGTRTSGGVFSVNPDGYASLEIYAPQPLSSYDSIGVSVEPFGGSPAPTGERVLTGAIPQ